MSLLLSFGCCGFDCLVLFVLLMLLFCCSLSIVLVRRCLLLLFVVACRRCGSFVVVAW